MSGDSILLKIPNVVQKIRGTATDAVELSEYSVIEFSSFMSSSLEDFFVFKYIIDGKSRYSNCRFDSQDTNINVYNMLLTLINKTMRGLAYDGKLRQNLEKLYNDFPCHKEYINSKLAHLLQVDSVRTEVIKIREAEAARKAQEAARKAQEEVAKKAEYRANHPILSRIQAFFGK